MAGMGSEPRRIEHVELLYVNVTVDEQGRRWASSVIRDLDSGNVYEIPGGQMTVVETECETHPGRVHGLCPECLDVTEAQLAIGPRCLACRDTGYVCENHPDRLWAPECCAVPPNVDECEHGACQCGAGMPCPACCSPLPQDGLHRATDAYIPDWKRQP